MISQVIGRERIADITTARGFSAAYIPPTENDTLYAQVQVQESDMRYCVDGTTPVAGSKGFILAENGIIEIWGADALINFLACDESAGDTVLEVIYYGRGG